MATTPTASSPFNSRHPKAPGGTLVEYEQYIEQQLDKTRSQVRSVDLACSLLTLAVGLLIFFLAVALVDHWLVPGGLGFWGRLACLIALLSLLTYFTVTQIAPLLLRRINPVFAAHTIERSKPGLKNSLVNFLLFRSNPGGVSQPVFEAIEEQAAQNLARTPIELAVDRSKLILIGYVLLGVLLVGAAYELFSPKDPLRTAGRVLMPWAEIQAATRTTISEVQPGDATAFRGERVVVSADVHGVGTDDPVRLVVSTSDGQVVEQAILMQLPAEGYRYIAELTTGDEGLQQSAAYRIEAGDCVTKSYRVDVVAAPTIVVRAIDYAYPEYTGLLPQTLEGQGDIKAIEGTKVTVHALANQPIQSATIDFGGDGAHRQSMHVEGDHARGSFELEMNADRSGPWHSTYRLKLKNDAGQENPRPIEYHLDVTPDLVPEISFLAPRNEEIELPANGAITCEVVANDPDFALRRVRLIARRGTRQILDKGLLDEVRRGQLTVKFRFSAKSLGLKQGDLVEYWAVAEDNKQPRPNHVETAKRRFRVVAPLDQQAGAEDQAPKANQDQVEIESEQKQSQQKSSNNADASTRDDARQQDKSAGKQDPSRGEDQEQKPTPPDQQQPEQDGPKNKSPSAKDEEPSNDQGDASNRDQPSDKSKSKNGNQKDDERQQPNEGQQGDGDDKENQPGQQGAGDEQQKGPQGGKDQQQKSGDPAGSTGKGEANQAEGQKHADKERQSGGGKNGNASDSGDQQGHDSSPVASDGSNDGDAFERILEHRQKQAKKGQRKEGRPNSNNAQGGQSPTPGDREKNPSARPENGDLQGEQAKADHQADVERQPNAKQQPNDGGENPQRGGRRDGQREPNQQSNDGQAPSEPQTGNTGERTDGKQPSGEAQQRPSQAPGENGEQNPEAASQPDAKPQSDTAGQTARDGKPKSTNKSPAEKTADGRKPAQTNQDPTQNAEQQETEGRGAQSKGSAREEQNKRPSDSQQRPNAKGGDPNENKGESGAGREGRDDKGSPSPTEPNRQRRKTQSNMKEEKNRQEGDDPAKSPAGSKHESDSQSNNPGDRKGGGGEGGGQKSDKPGTGGAGKNTAADEGAGASPEQGEGQTSNEAGDQQQATRPTGKPSDQRGQGSGSTSRPQDALSPSGAESPRDQQDPQDSASPPKTSKTPSGGTTGLPQGAGKPPEGDFKPFKATGEAGPAETANLEFTKKATDLALQHLRDQLKKGEPDQELLDRLGWTREDLAQFLRRWEAMEARAKTRSKAGDTSQRELDEALRSLGLRPKSTSLQGNTARDDQAHGLKESPRVAPPAEYAEPYKAYTRGTARDD